MCRADVIKYPDFVAQNPRTNFWFEHFIITAEFLFDRSRRADHSYASIINIEALCAAPPEAFAHSPSQMPLSCPVAPPSQRELHKDGGGGGGGVARRTRAARAPKANSCATSCDT